MQKLTTKEFIVKAQKKHGEGRYNYNLVDYYNSKSRVKIICNIHGVFEQTSNSHLMGRGCTKCGLISMQKGNTKSVSEFIEDAQLKHGIRYDYSKVKYKNSTTKIKIICKTHGEFTQKPQDHLRGDGCKQCGYLLAAEKTSVKLDEFIKRSNDRHNELYDYSKSVINGVDNKIIIICKTHSEFMQAPAQHINGQGCPKCSDAEMGVWTEESFIRKSQSSGLEKDCIFYAIRCFNDSESFFKIGITSRSVKSRYSCESRMPYKFEIIHEIKSNASDVWNMERLFKEENKHNRYKPIIHFCGYTECFSELNIEVIL